MVTLIRSMADPYGASHSAARLSREVRRGRLLRLHRGVYITPEDWLRAPVWDRHVITCAALATAKPETVFCRQSALAIYGVPLNPTPTEITVLSSGHGQVGLRTQPRLTGDAPTAVIEAMLQSSEHVRSVSTGHQRLKPIAVRRSEPPLPRGYSRREYRSAAAAGEVILAEPRAVRPRLGNGELLDKEVLLEPPGQALVTSMAHMSLASGVVAADGARRGDGALDRPVRDTDIEDFQHLLRTQPMSNRFWESWNFSDPRAESAGESLSRVLIHQLGFVVPDLQHRMILRSGSSVRVDFWWEGVRLIGEFDGLMKYRQAQRFAHKDAAEAVIEEKRREDELRSLGCGLLRWTWADLQHPRRFADMLDAAGVPRA